MNTKNKKFDFLDFIADYFIAPLLLTALVLMLLMLVILIFCLFCFMVKSIWTVGIIKFFNS
jgi:hypothetical protein